jgi:prepilin signal peptidase PulO-like enzyme (type II secretory pathway)
MRPPFFPDLYFGWTFYAVLVGLTLIGSYIDLRKAVLPKQLTLTALGLGVLFNIVRGAWLGSQGQQVWLLDSGAWLGGLDGLLFSLAGFAGATAMFIVMWALKTCGGGDVKLFAAMGAWVGFRHTIYIMLGSVLVLFVMLAYRIMTGGLTPTTVQKRLKQAHVIQGGPTVKGPGTGKWRMTYAFPVAVATAVLLLWFYRVDLHLAASKNSPNVQQAEAQND